MKNEDESLETRGQRPLNWIPGLEIRSPRGEKGSFNFLFLFLFRPQFIKIVFEMLGNAKVSIDGN